MAFVGTSTSLERTYYRTAPTQREEVRPAPFLPECLAHLLAKAATLPEGVRYGYALGQLKSIRQDITTQGIGGGVAVEVYTANLAESIEASDSSEVTVCFAALQGLEGEGEIDEDAANKLLLQRVVFQSVRTAEVSTTDIIRLIDNGTELSAAVLRLAASVSSDSVYTLRQCYSHLTPELQRIVIKFGTKLRAGLLEKELRAAGPTSLSIRYLASVLFLHDKREDVDVDAEKCENDITSTWQAITAATGQEEEGDTVQAKPLYQMLCEKRAANVRRD